MYTKKKGEDGKSYDYDGPTEKRCFHLTRNHIIGALVALMCVGSFFICKNAFEDCDKSKNYVCQYPITGDYAVWVDGGLQNQLWGTLHEYNKTYQVEFTGVEKRNGDYEASTDNPAAAVTFNDRGKGYLIGSLRVVLPIDDEHMSKIQRDFGSQDALISALIRPTLYKVVTSCGPLMSSLESVSETRTNLQSYIQDQMNDGVYETRLIKEVVYNELSGDSDVISKAEIIIDNNSPGKYKRLEVSPFSQYGVRCNLVSITDIKYDSSTQEQIDAQKKSNLAKVTSKTKSLEAIQKTILVTEQGKQAAETAKWKQEEIKAREVTKAEQEKEVARLAAEKAEFDKRRIIAEGEAKAAANKALVSAGLTPIERATIEKEIAIGIAQALADSKVRWVPEVIMTGGNGSGNAMDAVGLNMMMDIVSKMNQKKVLKE